MPKEAFGGDDDSGTPAPEEKKRKVDLSRFSKGQDMNISALFWEIIEAYAEGKRPESFAGLENDRLALVRAAGGAIARPSALHAGLAPDEVSRYSLMMLLDAGWQDALAEFLDECGHRDAQRRAAAAGVRKLAADAKYCAGLVESLRAMLRGRTAAGTALMYLAEAGSAALARELKKELVIFARGDIGDNQLNAILALALLGNDGEVTKVMMALLTHWDEAARKAAAEALLVSGGDEAADAATKRLASETDPDIRITLEKIAKLKKR
jgi:hypothetical protein